MKRGMILAALLATLPVHALADGQKAPTWYGRVSSKLDECCGPTQLRSFLVRAQLLPTFLHSQGQSRRIGHASNMSAHRVEADVSICC